MTAGCGALAGRVNRNVIVPDHRCAAWYNTIRRGRHDGMLHRQSWPRGRSLQQRLLLRQPHSSLKHPAMTTKRVVQFWTQLTEAFMRSPPKSLERRKRRRQNMPELPR